MKKMQRAGWIIFFACIPTMAAAQYTRLDSLTKEFEIHPKQFNVLWNLAYELFDVNNERALYYAKLSHESALSLGDSSSIVKSGRIVGQLLRRVDCVDESIAILNYVLPIAKRQPTTKELKLVLNALAVSYLSTSEFDKALRFHFEGLAIRERDGSKNEISSTYMNIGVVYYQMDDFEAALDFYTRSLKIKKEFCDSMDSETILINIGLCLAQLHRYSEALGRFDEALNLCARRCDDNITVQAEFAIGDTYFKVGDYCNAEFHLHKAYTVAMANKSQRWQIETLTGLTAIAMKVGDFRTARNRLDMINEIQQRNQFFELMIPVYRLNADYFTEFKNYEKANFYERKYNRMKDFIFNAELRAKLMNERVKFSQRENLERIKFQSDIMSIQSESLRRKELLIFAVGVSAILAFSLSVLLIRRNREKQKMNELLKNAVLERTFELEKNRDELWHAHNEQRIIIKKVGDDLKASLATIKGLSILASRELPTDKAVYFVEAEVVTERLVKLVGLYDLSD